MCKLPPVVFFAAITLMFGCQRKSQPIGLEGTVYRGSYETFGADPSVSPIAYRVFVRVKNSGSSSLVFDEIEASFIPAQGRALRTKTYRYDGSKDHSATGYSKDDNKATELAPEEIQAYDWTTNGYTFSLLRDSGAKPLTFSVRFLYKGALVAGPFRAILPELMTLPSYEESLFDKTEKGHPLTFSPEGPTR